MNPILSNLSEILTSLFQSVRLSFIIPSFIFWSMNALFLYGVLPLGIKDVIDRVIHVSSLDPLSFVVILSLSGGYFLFVLNTPIIRWFEGYPWQQYLGIRWLNDVKIKQHRDIRKKLLKEHNLLETRVQELSKDYINLRRKYGGKSQHKCNQITLEIDEIKIKKAWYVTKLQQLYPASKPPFLPTRLGNVIASFEDYSYNKYKIDSVTIWPRFLPVLSQVKYALYLEREKANFDFLINLCLIAILFCGELLLVGLLYAKELNEWLMWISFFLCIAYILYLAAISGALGWGNTVRVAFDLYRFELLTSLKVKLPNNNKDEKTTWQQISIHFHDFNDSQSLNIDYDKIACSFLQSQKE